LVGEEGGGDGFSFMVGGEGEDVEFVDGVGFYSL